MIFGRLISGIATCYRVCGEDGGREREREKESESVSETGDIAMEMRWGGWRGRLEKGVG